MTMTIVPEELEEYALAHTTPLPPLLDELIDATEQRTGEAAGMLCGQVEGTFLQMLAGLSHAKRVLEIGMFTGFSAQMMAAALPDDGKLITCEIDPERIAMAKEFFARSPYGRKIEVREGPALDTLASLDGPFDLIFIDADKSNYVNYYEAALPLLSRDGVLVADNVLWSGRVLDPQERDDHAIVAFNDHVQRDPRVTNVLLSLRDGVMLVRWAR